MTYEEFIRSKIETNVASGFEVEKLGDFLFPEQEYITRLALRNGKFAIFGYCGAGKTPMQLEWAKQVSIYTGKPVLILAPLAVAGQTIEEGRDKFNVVVSRYSDSKEGVLISNYEQLENIDASIFGGIVLDESSILKNFSGVYRNLIIEKFADTPYKLACTATPSPNDHLELGNHAEFLNVMSSSDMRAKFFTTDKEIIHGEKFRLKKHAIKEFFKWVGTWSVCYSKPSDLGFSDKGYKLPPLNIIEEMIVTDKKENGLLFNDTAVSATDFNGELRRTKVERLERVAEIVNASKENFIVWIKHNEEADYLLSIIPDAVEVRGNDSSEKKEANLLGFAHNKFRVLITKAKIAQFGLNFQNCHNQIHASLDFSFESLYQSIRRSYRRGQKHAVNIYLITTDTMSNVAHTINRKQKQYEEMQKEMIEQITSSKEKDTAKPVSDVVTDNWKILVGDCVKRTDELPDNSIDYSFFSPPFGALYVFSNNPLDMSNVQNDDEFMKHFEFLVPKLFNKLRTGRLLTIHIMQGTTLLGRDGFYSIKDFRGEMIRMFQKYGFHLHGENMIRKDPKTAAIRTKNRQLMYGTTKKDSTIVRPGLADYLLTFKKPGENLVPVQNNIPFDLYCQMAEPVWMDVSEGDTVEYRGGREEEDERHITATQLQPIEWLYMLYTNEGETVYSPFGGVQSEGVVAVKMKRKYIGCELKESYVEQGVKNLQSAEKQLAQEVLF